MNGDIAAWLISDAGRNAYDLFAGLSGDTQRRVLTLRNRDYTLAQVAGVAELWDARAHAARRFSRAHEFFWTKSHAAQATSPVVAEYHAELLHDYGTVADLGCGVGMDTIVFGQNGMGVTAVERDEAAFRFAQENVRVAGMEDRVTLIHGDATTAHFDTKSVYFDPTRRDGNARYSLDISRYEPPITWAGELISRFAMVVVKLSPGLSNADLQNVSTDVDFLSENRECKEACAVLTPPGGFSIGTHRAILLPEYHIFTQGIDAPIANTPLTWILDPDAAVVRAGALNDICAKAGAFLLSPDDAYLTSQNSCPPRWGLSYLYLETMPYQPRKVASRLTDLGAKRLVVKKRHGVGDTESVLREMRWRNAPGREVTLILVRRAGKTDAILCESRT